MVQRKSEIKYAITQSPLYKLSSKKKLVSLLNLSSYADLKSILRIDEPYRKFTIKSKGKQRPVEVPSRQLIPLHNRLFSLLQRLELPDYLHSGIKGRSYLSNAKAHRGMKETYTLDIKKFYPSVTRAKVASYFRINMKCEPDIAAILADITTCEGHIPTGSPLSQTLAYLACKDMFDTLFMVCNEADLIMTCYVDDLTISGDKITKKWVHDCIKPIITKFGMKSHKDKFFGIGRVKEITGVIVDGSLLKVCNRLHKSIHDLSMQISVTEDPQELSDLYNKLVGKLSAAGQIDDRFIKQRVLVARSRRKLKQKTLPKEKTRSFINQRAPGAGCVASGEWAKDEMPFDFFASIE